MTSKTLTLHNGSGSGLQAAQEVAAEMVHRVLSLAHLEAVLLDLEAVKVTVRRAMTDKVPGIVARAIDAESIGLNPSEVLTAEVGELCRRIFRDLTYSQSN